MLQGDPYFPVGFESVSQGGQNTRNEKDLSRFMSRPDAARRGVQVMTVGPLIVVLVGLKFWVCGE